MERMTYRDETGRARLTLFGKQMYCSTQATADCICKLEEALENVPVPKVMMLDEVVALPEDSVVWLEDNDKPDVIAGLMVDSRVCVSEAGRVVMLIRFVAIRDGGIIKVTGNAEDYMTRWRCWTTKPNDGQKEAVPWDKR